MSQTLTYVMGGDRRAHVDNIQDFKVDFSDDNHNWVQARQFERGMRQVFVNVTNEDGTPFDLTGCNVWFEGLLPKTADGDFRVIDDDGYVPLDPSAGKFRYDMPGHAFTVAGSYRQAFFRILKNNNSVTTLEFDLDVLADKVIDGLVPKTWIGPFEQIADQLVDDLQKHTDAADKIIADFQQKVTDLVNQLNQQGSTTTSMLTELQNRITDLETKIKQDGLFTQAEANTFEESIQKLIDTQNASVKALTDKVSSNELLLSGYNVRDFGAVGDGETDDTAAIQKTITQVALDWKNGNFKTNLVVMPAGRYKVTSSIVLPPYVKLISAGLVTIESYLTDGATIQIKWLGDDDPDINGKGLGDAYQIQDWQRGYIIEGSRGGFSLISKVKTDTNIGIEIGFRSAEDRGASGLKNVARSGLNNIAIGNYGIGMRLNNLDFFIFNFTNMHIENNNINVQNAMVDGGGADSGENIYFDRCVICGGNIGIDQIWGVYDMTLNECSLGLNKLAISNSAYSDNNITIIGGNLEGNTLIYDASEGSTNWFKDASTGGVDWLTSLNIISTNIYIRPDKASSLTMFKGPLVLNLDNPYIIGGLELDHPEYVCDENVFVTYNRNPAFSRVNEKFNFITERDNALFYGNNIAKLPFKTDNGYGKVVTKDNGLSPELQAAGFTSSFKYTKSATDANNWDWMRPTQKIDVSNKSAFLLVLFGLAHLDLANIQLAVSFYDQADNLIESREFFSSVSSNGLDKVIYARTVPQHIPVEAASAMIGAFASCTTNGASFEFAYLGLEME